MPPSDLPLWLLAALQAGALALLVMRLAPGRHRRPPVPPYGPVPAGTTVTAIVTTLDEVRRVGPCLAGLSRQGPALAEVLVVDSRSTDGTVELVRHAVALDPRVRLITDPPLPAGWVGKVWALQTGLRAARGEWVLGIDADTEPQPGLVEGAVAAAGSLGYDVVSFSPCFAGQGAGEQWLQPALLATLVYRFGAAGVERPAPDRVMANGQCFLARRRVLERHGGYEPARASFCDDVTLARHLARRGARVGFLDGSRLIRVRAYTSARETWREWGRSLDLKDASTRARQWGDVAFLVLAQGAPLPALLLLAAAPAARGGAACVALLAVNVALLVVRLGVLAAMRGSYERTGWTFWLSPLADPLAALRILLSTLRRPRAWRGRRYPALQPG